MAGARGAGGTELTRTDQEIVRLCLDGDRDAFAVLVERYGGRVYNIALRITGNPDSAADCAQDALVRAYRALHRYDPELPFGPWVFRIATNASLNQIRGWRSKQSSLDEVAEFQDAPEHGPESLTVRREEVAEAISALGELSPAYRAALTLRHIQQLTYQEVADVLNLPLGTVKTHLRRARVALRGRIAARSRQKGTPS